jgi:histidinol-phosphate/aromatic aminotransferase/cobyric acid decarboxylase-like protein
MAGLRVGYLLSSAELAREVHKATLPYNLNFFSATAAEVACERCDLLVPLIEKIVGERERLFAEMSKISGISPVDSHANFLVARTRIHPRNLFDELLARDILIRDVSRYPMLGEYFRASVGSAEENSRLIGALKDIKSAE